MKKAFVLTLFAIMSLALLSCAERSRDEEPTFDAKPVEGIAAIFDEELGYYNRDAVVLQLDATTRVVYYTTNLEKNVEGDVIAMRLATLDGSDWVYGPRQIVLEPSDEGWDARRVGSVSVVKGAFNYAGTTYDYLMAYQGNNIGAERNFQIGLAFAENPEGPWIKYGENPFIAYDPIIYGSQFGAGQPSLVSYDQAGQVRLFYTFADEAMTMSRLMELDLSDMDDIKGFGAYLTISVQGLEDRDLGVAAMMNNAGFAYDPVTSMLYAVRDRNPLASTPPNVAEQLQVVRAPLNILYEFEPNMPQWEILARRIGESETAVDDLLGWQRIYSGAFVTDAYGHLLAGDGLEIVFSSSAVATSPTDETYRYTPAVHILEIGR